MKNVVAFVFAAIIACSASAAAPDLKAFMATGKNYLEPTNIGWRTFAGGNVCSAMKSVGLGCSYNDRVALVDFLYENGTVLFPCEGNTNPYFNSKLPVTDVGNCAHPFNKGYENMYYIGQPVQNEMLAKAVKKNRALFKRGNLSAADAKKWK